MSNSLKVTPYPYQQEGIKYALEHKRLIIGDEPGLGKTLQSIGTVTMANAFPCLVVCPSSLKINWQREWQKFTDHQALVLSTATQATYPYLLKIGMYDIAIVNYESIRKYLVWDIKGGTRGGFRLKDVVFNPAIKLFRSVIIDESHRVKDPSAGQTIFCKGIAYGKPYVILLSGTPVVNRPDDLISQLSIMNRLQDFGGATRFRMDYCTNPKDKDAKPLVPLSVLSEQLYSKCLIRREKAKVLPQLPDKTRVDLYVDISNRPEYELAAEDLAEYLFKYKDCSAWEIRRKMRMEALVKFMTLRSIATMGKVKQAVDFIETFLASGKKLIVFCSLHDIVDALGRRFPRAVQITGRNSATEKQTAVDRFQNDPATQLIICSIRAAGVGLTLTAASDVAFIELPWTYADCCQCEDRAHRIGQKNNVTVYYLLAHSTIDTVIYSLINKKKSVAAEIMNSDDDIPKDAAYFDEIVGTFLDGFAHMSPAEPTTHTHPTRL